MKRVHKPGGRRGKLGGAVFFVAIGLATLAGGASQEDDDLALREEQAMKAAVLRVAPSVVAIDTVGGLERVGETLIGTGPTTGLVVSSDGYIVSSAFNFVQHPSAILVGLADGRRLPARLIATDHNRMVVLLKVETDLPLPVPEAVPQSEVAVGQWGIAVGRAFDALQTNVSVGIISALDRVWGKAIQTDAKISPSNYGGPLVDIQGRVLGVLVPLSPHEAGEMAGVEWYDGGIGFAVPLDHIQQVLPRLQQGESLRAGVLGVNLATADLYSESPVIAACRPNSPAWRAGLKAGDRISAVDGEPVERGAQLLRHVHGHYAGDTLRLAVLRGEERLEYEVQLVDHLDPYRRPMLGILPMRGTPPGDDPAGVRVRYVFAESGASQAGIMPGDKIVSVAGTPVTGREHLAQALASTAVGQTVAVVVHRGDADVPLDVVLAAETAGAPGELPSAFMAPAAEAPAAGALPAGPQALRVSELPNECLAYIPSSYDPALDCGLIIWLAGLPLAPDDEILARFKDVCERERMILLAPRPADTSAWRPGDLEFIKKAADQLRASYTVDPFRIVVVGQGVGSSVACALAFQERDLIRGVATIDPPQLGMVPDNEPLHRLSFWTAAPSTLGAAIPASMQPLADRGYAITVVEHAEKSDLPENQARNLDEDELLQLLRWIDSLDWF